MILDESSAQTIPLVSSVWQVLLVSSSRHPDQWIVPGGGMEPEEDPCGAAVREVFEEVTVTTGVIGLDRNLIPEN